MDERRLIMKRVLKRIVSSIVFLSILIGSVLIVNNVFVTTYNHNWYIEDRVQQLDGYSEGDINALYVGGSKVSVGVVPVILWNKTGLTGINIATNTQPPIVSKYLTIKYVDKLKPDYVFLDPSGMLESSSVTSRKVYRYGNGLQLLDGFMDRAS